LFFIFLQNSFAHEKTPKHQGDHMHMGKMSNHSNYKGLSTKELKAYNKCKEEKKQDDKKFCEPLSLKK